MSQNTRITQRDHLSEERETRLSVLRSALAIGERQADRSEFADYRLQDLLDELDAEDRHREGEYMPCR